MEDGHPETELEKLKYSSELQKVEQHLAELQKLVKGWSKIEKKSWKWQTLTFNLVT